MRPLCLHLPTVLQQGQNTRALVCSGMHTSPCFSLHNNVIDTCFDSCRNEEFAIGAFAQVCATALQAGMLHERLRQPPPITKHITSSLTRQAALELCAEQASAICRVQAVRIVFPAGKVCNAYSQATSALNHSILHPALFNTGL